MRPWPYSRKLQNSVTKSRKKTGDRRRELEFLLDGFERAKAGKGQSFSLISEAGLGKSRLLYEE